MRRLTLKEARAAVARVTQNGECPDNPIVAERINEAQEHLINKGKWAGLVYRYAFCTHGGCITLPRELDSVLAVAVNRDPIRIANEWYEFLDTVGIQSCGGNLVAIPRGNSVLFRDICGAKRIRVFSDLPEAVGSSIYVRGLDENGNVVMTIREGQWIEGEYIPLTGTPQTSTKLFSVVTSVVKPVTVGPVRLYQVDPVSGAQSAIAVYARGETLPSYRRYQIPGLGCGEDCPATVTVLAKRRFVPAVDDHDDLLITNLSALKFMVMALEKYESAAEPAVGKNYEDMAIKLLDDELKEYEGGATPTLNVQMRSFGAGGVAALY